MSAWTALVIFSLLSLHGIAIIYIWHKKYALVATVAAVLIVAGTGTAADTSFNDSFFQAIDRQIVRGWC